MFVTLATLLCIGFAGWCIQQYLALNSPGYLGVAGLSALGAVGLLVYGKKFLNTIAKLKHS